MDKISKPYSLIFQNALYSFFTFIFSFMIFSGCQSTGVHEISDRNYYHPVSSDPSDVTVYLSNPDRNYAPIAFVDSFVHIRLTNSVKADQLRDLQVKAHEIGADAIIEIEQLEEHREGMVADPTIPFHAWKQGDYELYFLRALAVRLEDSSQNEWEFDAAFASEGKNNVVQSDSRDSVNAGSVNLDSIELRTIPEAQEIQRPIPGQ